MPQLPDSFPIASHVVSLVDPMFEDLEESEVVEGNSVESEREILEEVGSGRLWGAGNDKKETDISRVAFERVDDFLQHLL